jgi:hypothetical protein
LIFSSTRASIAEPSQEGFRIRTVAGFGSGGYPHPRCTDPRPLEAVPALDVHALHHAGALVLGTATTWRWPHHVAPVTATVRAEIGRVVLTIAGGPEISVLIAWVPVSGCLEGDRPYFVCPVCNRNVWDLYIVDQRFGCRRCCNLDYGSRHRFDAAALALARIRRLRAKLGADLDPYAPLPPPPRLPHSRRVYDRIVARIEAEEAKVVAGFIQTIAAVARRHRTTKRKSVDASASSAHLLRTGKRGTMERDGNGDVLKVEVTGRDLAIFEQRMAGHSVHAIAQEIGISVKDVDAAIERACQPIDQPLRLRTIGVELGRFDRLTRVFWQAALERDPASAAVLMKISERRAAILGLDVPAGYRTDPVLIEAAKQPQQTTTERIRAALDRIAGKRPAGGNGTGEPDPDPSPAA